MEREPISPSSQRKNEIIPKVAPTSNGHVADIDIEVAPAEFSLDGVREGDFDLPPDENLQLLDATSLYMRDIGQEPMQIENHEEWGKAIFAGKIALAALAILAESGNSLSEEDGIRVSELLGKGKGKFLLERLYMNIQSARFRIKRDEYEGEKGERFKDLDIEFLETVSANEELTRNMLEARAINEDEDSRESNFHQFLDQQIRFADQGIQSFSDLVTANLRLPIFVARGYHVRTMSINDLISLGNEGLMLAAADWDTRREFQFSTYAIWWIGQKIKRGIDQEGSMIRVSVYAGKRLRKRRKEQGLDDKGDNPLPEILGDALRVQSVASLDRPFSRGGNSTLLDSVIDKDSDTEGTALGNVARDELQRILAAALSPKQNKVLRSRFGLGENAGKRTLEDIGREFGVTRERVRQIEREALKKLRSPEVRKALKDLAES